MIKCTNCGFDQIPDGALRCPQCSFPTGQPIPPMPGVPVAAPIAEIPWKKRDSLGFVQAFIENIKALATSPMKFFEKIRKDDDWVSPIVYGIIIYVIAGVINLVWSSLFNTFMMSSMNFMNKSMPFPRAAMGFGLVWGMFWNILIWPAILLFLWPALVHLAAMVFGDGEKGFNVTFQTAAYSGTPLLLAIVPVCGGFIGGICSLILFIIGMKTAHATETWKAVMSVLIWIIIFITCCGIIVFLGGLAAASLFHSASAS